MSNPLYLTLLAGRREAEVREYLAIASAAGATEEALVDIRRDVRITRIANRGRAICDMADVADGGSWEEGPVVVGECCEEARQELRSRGWIVATGDRPDYLAF